MTNKPMKQHWPLYLPLMWMTPQIVMAAGVKRPAGPDEAGRYDVMPLCTDRETAIAFIGNKQMPLHGAN